MAKTKVVRGICTVSGCGRPHKARGYCPAHLQRWMRGVEVAVPLRSRVAASPERCSEEGCAFSVKAKGLCPAHYAKYLRHGHTRFRDRKTPSKPCGVEGCESHLYANGVCHRHYIRARRAKEKYGITIEQVNEMAKQQDGVCAICQQVPRKRDSRSDKVMDFCIDHSHVTNKVRALLCDRCNRAIGMFEDSPSLLRAAAAYLDIHLEAELSLD